MKKLTLFALAIVLSANIFGQVRKYQPKVIAVFLGEKSPNFDESRFPDIDFYYVVKKNYKNPKGMFEGIETNNAFVFDKNAIMVSFTRNMNSTMGIGQASLATTKRGEFTSLNVLSKDYIKKGKVMKPGKKFKSKHPEKISSSYIGFNIPDFNISDAKGESVAFNTLVKDNPLTLVVFVHLENGIDGSKGTESGAGKSGSQYINDVNQTLTFDKQLKVLNNIEEEVFGKDMRR